MTEFTRFVDTKDGMEKRIIRYRKHHRASYIQVKQVLGGRLCWGLDDSVPTYIVPILINHLKQHGTLI